MPYKIIHEYLYKKHYLNYEKSSAISSHWDSYLKKNKITKKDDKYYFSTYGLFAQKKGKFFFLKNIIIRFNLFFFLKKNKVKKKIILKANEINKKLSLFITFDIIKNYIICNLLDNYLLLKSHSTICIIGDGYGYLGQLIKFFKSDIKIIYINIGVNLLIDSYFFSLIFKEEKPLLLDKNNTDQISNSSVIFVEAENVHLLSYIDINIFISIASMQEMNNSTITDYFNIFRNNISQPFFYCCNRMSKKLKDGSIINFDNYPWHIKDKIIFEEECKWYTKYPTYFPFYWKPFNGKLKHKLVKIVNLKNE